MQIHFDGIIIGFITFLIIGCFHPLVIKAEYYFGQRSIWFFAIAGIVGVLLSLLMDNEIGSIAMGVFAFSSFWGIGEVIEQKKRVKDGRFPMNPKRKHEYD